MGDDLHMFNRTILDEDPETPSPDIDDGSPENLKKLRNFAETIMEDRASELDHVCDILVNNRDKKAARAKDKKSIFGFFSGE